MEGLRHEHRTMKKPLLAFTLSFFLPGAGLAYLGKWKWAFINLGVVLLVGVVLALVLPDEMFYKYMRYVAVGCSGGSAGYAYSLAQPLKQKTEAV